MILDEPSTGLDHVVQQELHNPINETCGEGRTVFLSSHTLSEVERVADRVGIVRHGRLVEVATMADPKARAVRRLDLELADEVDPDRLAGVKGLREVTALLGIFFGSLALATGVAADHHPAVVATVSVAILAYVVATFRPVAEGIGDRAALAPPLGHT